MTETPEFKKWHRIQTAKHLGILADIEKEVEKSLQPNNLVVEIKNESGCWTKEG